MKIFVTSDHHFCHKNIIRYCKRPFRSVREMNETMIRRWNKVVDKGDLVFHLGDFAFANAGVINVIRKRLNGAIIIILGNHDRIYKLKRNGFIITHNKVIRIGKLLLSHRPLQEVPLNFINLCGHIHDKKAYGNRINISVDRTNFYPQRIEKFISNLN